MPLCLCGPSRVVLFLVACALCLGVAPDANATVLMPAEFSDVVNGSTTIVRGRVVDVRSGMTAGRRSIYSIVTVAVDETLKGRAGRTVAFRIPTGQVGRYRRIVVGSPEFRAGEEVVVFLTGAAPRMPTLFGLSQGVIRVPQHSAARRRAELDLLSRSVRAVVEGSR